LPVIGALAYTVPGHESYEPVLTASMTLPAAHGTGGGSVTVAPPSTRGTVTSRGSSFASVVGAASSEPRPASSLGEPPVVAGWSMIEDPPAPDAGGPPPVGLGRPFSSGVSTLAAQLVKRASEAVPTNQRDALITISLSLCLKKLTDLDVMLLADRSRPRRARCRSAPVELYI
jgi:hypothetical protein